MFAILFESLNFLRVLTLNSCHPGWVTELISSLRLRLRLRYYRLVFGLVEHAQSLV
jgi:hypothetical protein